VEAQRKFASEDRDKDGMFEYASDPPVPGKPPLPITRF
jgi:hypothetical protein